MQRAHTNADIDTRRCSYVFSYTEADKLKKQFENTSCSRFVVLKSDGNFGKMRTYNGNQVIQWYCTGKDATPFIHIGKKMYECHRGKDWKAKVKQEKKEARLKEKSGDPEAKKSRKTKGTKKAGCPARITMREIMIFPAYQVRDGMFQRRRTSLQLRAMLNETPDAGERRIYVSFPSREDHHGHHLVDSDRDNVALDSRLLSRIHELQASSQVQTVSDMKFLLKEFVTDVLCKDEPLPHKKDRRFFPTVSDIRKVLKRSSNTEHSKRFLVVHCQGESLDSRSDPSGFEVRVIDDVLGKFEVVSGGKSGNVNTVEFSSLSQSGLPACSCSVWYKGRPPCEHFRAVFDLTSWGIERVPEEWRNFTDAEPENEYFMATLTPASKDQSCPQGESDLSEEEAEGGEMLCTKDSTVEQREEKELRLAEKAVDKIEEDILYDLRQECQDQLHRLEDLTHLINSTEALSRLKNTLMESVRDLEGLVSSDGGITLE